jgi:hypothetical protein
MCYKCLKINKLSMRVPSFLWLVDCLFCFTKQRLCIINELTFNPSKYENILQNFYVSDPMDWNSKHGQFPIL